jgi:hypothetical protein
LKWSRPPYIDPPTSLTWRPSSTKPSACGSVSASGSFRPGGTTDAGDIKAQMAIEALGRIGADAIELLMAGTRPG